MILSDEQCNLYTRGLDKYVPDDLLDTIDALRADLVAANGKLADLEGIDKVADFASEHVRLLQLDIDKLDADLAAAEAAQGLLIQVAAEKIGDIPADCRCGNIDSLTAMKAIEALASIPATLRLAERDAEAKLAEAEWWVEIAGHDSDYFNGHVSDCRGCARMKTVRDRLEQARAAIVALEGNREH